ncbi:hypothetical protein D3C78_746890 [compost metagenome]
MPRQVDDDAVGQRLAVGTGTTTARGQLDRVEARLGHQRGNARNVLGVLGKHRRLRQALVDRVVGRQHGARGVVGTELATETGSAQGIEKIRVQRGRCSAGQSGDHRGMASFMSG